MINDVALQSKVLFVFSETTDFNCPREEGREKWGLPVVVGLEELGLPVELLARGLWEGLRAAEDYCRREAKCRVRSFRVEGFRDAEDPGWVGVVLVYRVEGEYDALLSLWPQVSQAVSRITGPYGESVYTVIEPYEDQ